ncbi:UNKNOWN [Stylonychia lemnae]|uniref:Uncharacterized protein n=1 Tax=Stylonychia lemnae TaxID=5949 RepID=A0A078AAQ6_STYLE|nr:UNKNOWN [Stylonychia lemnae]|eukprot:CDW79365.1 UNKNOWN [Stylonychia lemnae]
MKLQRGKIAAYGKKNFSRSFRYNDSDVILFSYNGDVMTLKSAMFKNEMPDLLSIRGFSQTIQLKSYRSKSQSNQASINSLSDQDGDQSKNDQRLIQTNMWSPITFAIFKNQLEVVKFFMSSFEEKKRVNPYLALIQSIFVKEKQSYLDEISVDEECLCYKICVSNRSLEMVSYLLTFSHVWKAKHIEFLVKEIIKTDWNLQALSKVIESKSFANVVKQIDDLQQQIDFFDKLFGEYFEFSRSIEETRSTFDDSIDESERTQYRDTEKYYQKWVVSIIKCLVRSNFAIVFTFLMIRISHGHQNQTNLEVTLESLTEKQVREQCQDFTMQQILDIFSSKIFEQALDHEYVRTFYDTMSSNIHIQDQSRLQDHQNHEIQFFRHVKKANVQEISQNSNIYRQLKYHQIQDSFGEVDFSENEQNLLLSLFKTNDVSILRRLNPINMAILYNHVNILRVFIDKWGYILRRRDIKCPDYKLISKSNNGLMIFEAAVKLKNHSMFKYLWDNHAYLFRLSDFCQGTKIIIESKDQTLIAFLLNSHTTHEFFNIFSFSFRFTYLSEYIFNSLQAMIEDTVENKQVIALVHQELHKQPFAFYTFAIFYEHGLMLSCLKSLDNTSQRDVALFVKHNPKSADKFITEIIKDEVAMKLHDNFTQQQKYIDQSKASQNIQQTQLESQKLREKEIETLENIKLFRESLENFARSIQMELKILDMNNSKTKSQTSSNS